MFLFVLIVQIKVVRRVGRVSPRPTPLPPPPLKAVMIIFIFYKTKSVHSTKNHGSLLAARSCARRWPIRTHFRHCNVLKHVSSREKNIV